MKLFRHDRIDFEIVVRAGFAPATKRAKSIDYIDIKARVPIMLSAFGAVPVDLVANWYLVRAYAFVLFLVKKFQNLGVVGKIKTVRFEIAVWTPGTQLACAVADVCLPVMSFIHQALPPDLAAGSIAEVFRAIPVVFVAMPFQGYFRMRDREWRSITDSQRKWLANVLN